ncbi:EAL domain-containing protein [Halobacillus locisalis]|uniref:EAL domain-containing protein n=1 Tax=Halobacillus locisalis TaxID=220753 RepID=A0A838CRG6_9BACI|nr:EAL domain-containing protein [Halobacillus locisalis]MBA2174468.1 EAL domain-containing protein [Halobacillus locisalis]
MSTSQHVNTFSENAKTEFTKWLNHKQLSMHFQPIIHTTTKTVQGYEALTRFPQSNSFSNPMELFQFAEEMNQLFRLEKQTRELAIELMSNHLHPHQKLWVNLSPNVIHDKNFTPGFTHSVLKDSTISPNQIVFEITEQSAITDFDSFRELLNHYREQGFTIAVDDVGSGYSSLQAISEIKPDYLKVDRSLITDIHTSSEKQFMLEALQQISLKMGSILIAEGVETEQEFSQLNSMGVEMMQGYYFAKPTFPPPEVPSNLMVPNHAYNRDQQAPLRIDSLMTLNDFFSWLRDYTGPIDKQLAIIETKRMRAVIPLQEVIRFSSHSIISGLSSPMWKELIAWWRS